MKKLQRLIEIKRQAKMANERKQRADKKLNQLKHEKEKILDSITRDEWNLYRDRISTATQW